MKTQWLLVMVTMILFRINGVAQNHANTSGENGSISGRIFEDINFNGVYDEGTDNPLSNGWTVRITGPSNITVTPNNDGTYEFSDIPIGIYTINEEVPQGWTAYSPFSNGSYSADLTINPVIENKDFANINLIRPNPDAEVINFPYGLRTGINTDQPGLQTSPQSSFPMTIENLPINVIHLEINSNSITPNTFTVEKNQIVLLALTNTNTSTYSAVFRFYDTKLSAIAVGVGQNQTKMIIFKAYNVSPGEEIGFYNSMFNHAELGATGSMKIKANGPTTGINEKESNDNLSIYPNPFTNQISITGIERLIQIKIYDISSKLLIDRTIHSKDVIDVENLALGIYLVKIFTDHNVYEYKVIKKQH